MLTYAETEDFLFSQLPVFQRDGAAALKHKLDNIITLCSALGNPQEKFKSIHIAGTNGKGSSSHYLASILQEAGYKVGLYTSPHLKHFTERIKINGVNVNEQFVIEFTDRIESEFSIKPSFFEITVAMAFDYFADQNVDIAIIETGLGGRYDSTNIIQPELSLITNISLDHQQYLGDTLKEIAFEKAGIIKAKTPVVISETQEVVKPVFVDVANGTHSDIVFADEYVSKTFLLEESDLPTYQLKNLKGVTCVLDKLEHFVISNDNFRDGVRNVIQNTGLKGRWQTLGESPKVICDTGHNEAAMEYFQKQLKNEQYTKMYFVLGMVQDKDHDKVLQFLPRHAYYIFTQPDINRALTVDQLEKKAMNFSLKGEIVKSVRQAIIKAKELANKDDLIFIGGSNFVVAEIEEL